MRNLELQNKMFIFSSYIKSIHVFIYLAEIHYEDFLPKDLWLEMKPRRFTTNHKHGNHFEIR